MTSTTPFLPNVGDRYRDFVLQKILYIKELQCTLRELVHEPSGAKVMHIANDDQENLFCLSFQTHPSSSNGVAHILEHTVLCGSKKFPVKDPFFAMSRRSLNTFMNALTGADFTCYPAASQVEKDFYNLLEVYIDAVFHPELKKMSFLQEGHRLEFAEPSNPKSALEYKGIVFNEMKGSLSSVESRLWHTMLENLCPDLTYGHNSGGDPGVIPQLTYEELIDFHETFYHPSRCLFFFYGNLPLKQHLDFLADHALKGVLATPPIPPIPKQRRFTTPQNLKKSYPLTETEDSGDKTLVAIGWLTAPLLNQEEILALTLLDSILMDTDASPLKRALLESGLCIQADGFMDIEMTEVPYVIVCKGSAEKDAEKLETFLIESLKKIAAQGIAEHLIEASLHQLEFSRTEITGDGAPFGLTIFMRSALAKQHGCNPENALMIHALFERLKMRLKDPQYLPALIKKYLIDNTHRIRLTLVPDPHLNAEEIKTEKNKLEELKATLTPAQIQEILKQSEELAQYQKQKEHQNIECLPKVDLQNVPVLARDFPLKISEAGNLQIFHHDCFTNHIIYADLVFDLPEIAEEDLPYLQLLLSLLPEVGAGKRDYNDNLEYMHAHTGGVGAYCALNVQTSQPNILKPSLSLRGKALLRKADKLFGLMHDMSVSPRFNEKKRIEELLQQINNGMQTRFTRNALRFAIQLALSNFSVAGALNNAWHGINYFKTMQEWNKNLKKKLPQIIEKLQHLQNTVFCLGKPHLVLGCDKDSYKELEREKFFGLEELPIKKHAPWKGEYAIPQIHSQARPISSPVAFTCEAFKTISYLHPHAPALNAATFLLDNKILHPRIREQGGAYGCGASYNAMTGSFYFHAYRDPHISRTLETFEVAIEAIASGQFEARDIEEAKLGTIQHLDLPIAPGSRALTAYSWLREGKTHEMRQNYRNHLLALTSKEITMAVEKELLAKKDKGLIITFAGKELIADENALLATKNRALQVIPI